MGLREAVKVCFQDYYTFSGRATRSEYWWFILFCVIGSVILSTIDQIVFGANRLLGLSGLFGMLTLLPQIAVAWRRMHDIGRPGAMNLLPAVPLVPLLSGLLRGGSGVGGSLAVFLLGMSVVLMMVVVVMLILPSQPGANRYGDPAPD
ncbi:MAG TPA: DUF805 domain-containing protein [Thermohalobaculum sp.]|nr:DUF805 domain-containing protein [Thermohalobaculum sp.]